MLYKPPIAKLSSVERNGEVVVTVIEQLRPPPDPIAPGALYEAENSSCEVFQLHKLVDRVTYREHDRLTFETYGTTGPLPDAGKKYELRSWWSEEAMRALLDPEAGWEQAMFEGDDDDERCLFTWEPMHNFRSGYRSKYGWVTADAYQRFVVDDILQMRAGI